MPRLFPSQHAASEASAAVEPATTTTSRWRRAWDSGTILLTIGWSGLALLTVDRYLQWQQRARRHEAVAMAKTMEEEIQRDRFRLHQKYKDTPALFHCVIRREYKSMSGSHGLRGVQVGDIVEILDEGVGPDRAYNLCRHTRASRKEEGSSSSSGSSSTDKEIQIGWFPIPFMEKVPPPKQSLWRRFLRKD